jgi:glutamate N-acetyltransferase/amino-acid N-acetyltransferase
MSADVTIRVDGSITAPKGFRAAGVARHQRPESPRLRLTDLALSQRSGVTAAAVFTTNKAVAAPVIVSREHLSRTGGQRQPWS